MYIAVFCVIFILFGFLVVTTEHFMLSPCPHDFFQSCLALFGEETAGLYEQTHEVMVLFVLRKLILQSRMCGHPVGLDV